jgi:hypothetical protein
MISLYKQLICLVESFAKEAKHVLSIPDEGYPKQVSKQL